MSAFKRYISELETECIGGEGIPDIIKEVPNIFKTLTALLEDEDIRVENRRLVFLAVGYFFIPNDSYPEEIHGQIGYIDDVMLCLEIFQTITKTKTGYSALQRCWALEMDQDETLEVTYPEIQNVYAEQYIDVMNYVGLTPENYNF